MHKAVLRSALTALVIAGAAAPQAATAQAWIGQVAGDMVAAQIDAQKRSDCFKQDGTAFVMWSEEGPKVDGLMKAFVDASAAGDGKAVKGLFARKAGSGLKGIDGAFLEPRDIKLPAGAAPERVAVAFVVFGREARGIWTQAAADPAAPKLYYTADFGHAWGGKWKIRQVKVTAAPEEPPSFDLTAYCLGEAMPAPLW